MNREAGFYWVNPGDGWKVAKWFTGYSGSWLIAGTREALRDSDFEEINENRIEEPCHTLA